MEQRRRDVEAMPAASRRKSVATGHGRDLEHPSFSLGLEDHLEDPVLDISENAGVLARIDKNIIPSASHSLSLGDPIVYISRNADLLAEMDENVMPFASNPTSFANPTKEVCGKKPGPNVNTRGKKRQQQFADLDINAMEVVRNVSKNTVRSTTCVEERFYAWRKQYASKLGIINVEEKLQNMGPDRYQQLGREIKFFIQQVRKEDGSLYSGATVKTMLFSFGRILNEAREARMNRTGIIEEAIHIKKHPFFKEAWLAGSKMSILQAKNVPRPHSEKKLTDEIVMKFLDDEHFAPNYGKGLSRRVQLYCAVNFFIRVREESWKLMYHDFKFLEDAHGRYIEFLQRASKTHHPDLDHCDEATKRNPVKVYEFINLDLYETFAKYYSKLPPFNDDEDVEKRHLFVAIINQPANDTTWYQRANLGVHNLGKLGSVCTKIAGFAVTNNDLRHYGISRGCVMGIPHEYFKDLTGHSRTETLKKYDRSGDIQMRAMQQALVLGGRTENYEESLKKMRQLDQEIVHKKVNQNITAPMTQDNTAAFDQENHTVAAPNTINLAATNQVNNTENNATVIPQVPVVEHCYGKAPSVLNFGEDAAQCAATVLQKLQNTDSKRPLLFIGCNINNFSS